MADTLEALDSFVGNLNGKDIGFRKGEPVSADHPAVKKWPGLFAPVTIRHAHTVEQATAAPGEKRNVAVPS